MNRGVLYLYWGDKYDAEMKRSMESLKRYHPELPVEVVKLPDKSTYLDKAAMMDYSPFDSTLFLDTDTTVLDRLDFGFERAERYGLACCICECPWARRYGEFTGDLIEYNTGVLFFTKEKAKTLFDEWKTCTPSVDTSIRFFMGNRVTVMPVADQGSFTAAVEKTQFNPFVLPLNWNYRPIWHKTFFGPIKIWHDHSEVPEWLKLWNEGQVLEQSIIRFGANPK
jgi:hypothetical protein